MIYRHYVTRSPAMSPVSFPLLTQLQPLVSHIPSMLLLQGLCTCYSFALNTLPLNISWLTPSFHLDLCSNVSSPTTTTSFWKRSHVLSFQFSYSLATYSALYFFTAPLTVWHSIHIYLFTASPTKTHAPWRQRLCGFVHCSIPLCLELCLAHRRDPWIVYWFTDCMFLYCKCTWGKELHRTWPPSWNGEEEKKCVENKLISILNYPVTNLYYRIWCTGYMLYFILIQGLFWKSAFGPKFDILGNNLCKNTNFAFASVPLHDKKH